MINSLIRTANGLSMFVNGKSYTVEDTHINYSEIITAVREKRWDDIPNLVNLAASVEKYVKETLTDESDLVVNVDAGSVSFRGEELHGVIVDRIIDMASLGFDINPMARYLANLAENPSNKAVEQLYSWMEANGITITEDGHLLAFKRVRDDYKSFFDGETDNSIGTTPSLPRNKVDDRSEVTCSHGLHFCSHSYLPHYHGGQGKVLLLKINPRDVVSIPNDYHNAKGRACAYLILDELKGDARVGIEEHNVIPQPVVTTATDYNASNDYKDGYLAGYKDGRGKKAVFASADHRVTKRESDYFRGYEAGRADGRAKRPNLYGSGVETAHTGAEPDTLQNTTFRSNIEQRLFKVVAEQLGLPLVNVALDKTFVADYGADSLDTVELVMATEDEFGIQLTDEEAETCTTVRDAFELICKKLV